MTKREIIKETKEYYAADPSRRAVDNYGHCFYYQENTGNTCAIGRCLKDPKSSKSVNGDVDTLYKALGHKFEDNLLPQYRGHDISFWSDLQLFHDCNENWTARGLSEQGLADYNRLMRLYK